MTPYWLSRDSHICVQGDQLVVLDLTSGKYFGLDLACARALGRWVHGWPVSESIASVEGHLKILQMLLDRGVLTQNPSGGKPASPLRLTVPTISLTDTPLSQPPAIRTVHVRQFLVSIAYAAFALRWMSLKRVVRRVSRRKAANLAKHGNVDIDKLTELVMIFERLRPFAYTRRDTCLLNALALVEFLAHFNVFPEWVFGVRTAPFRAHCWLQYREIALTDTPLRVDQLTPIMMV